MAFEKNEKEYVPFFPKVLGDTKYHSDFKRELVSSESRLKELLGVEGVKISVDTETTGLNYDSDRVVGFSFSFSPFDGFYVPLRHKNGGNLNEKVCFQILFESMYKNETLFYNVAFDLIMLSKEGLDIDKTKTFEVMSLVHNADSNIKVKNLKWAASHYLGRESRTFEEVFGGMTVDFYSPEEVVKYAADDTANTFGLYEALFPILVKECPTTLKIDNKLAKSMTFYQRNMIYLDTESMKELVTEIKTKIIGLERSIFSRIGYQFVINSNRQLSTALLSIGVDTGARTKTGDLKLDAKTLEKIDHPIIKDIISISSLQTQLSSYAEKLAKQTEGHISWRIFHVPSGRLASGGESKKKVKSSESSYFLNLNFQNQTKPEPAMFQVIEDEGDGSILGYRFKEVEPSLPKEDSGQRLVEGMSQKMNVRKAITTPDNKEWYFVSIDYSSEELKLSAILSGEPVHTEAFKNNEDVHKKMAIEMFGEKEYNKNSRKKAKFANFGLLFGGNRYTLMNTTGLPESECEDIYQRFWEVLKVTKRWKSHEVSKVYANGGVAKTMFGRPRRLKHWLSSTIGGERRYGERSVTSHAVQGTAADIMRIVLIKLYEKIFKGNKRTEEVRFVGSVHDEVVFLIRKKFFNSVIAELRDIMNIKLSGWPFPLTTDVEVGYSYGNMFPFECENGVWKVKEKEVLEENVL